MILVYKYVTDERSGDVRAKLVGDLPDEDSLIGYGPGDYCVLDVATSKLRGGPQALSDPPSEIKSRHRREVYWTPEGLKVRAKK